MRGDIIYFFFVVWEKIVDKIEDVVVCWYVEVLGCVWDMCVIFVCWIIEIIWFLMLK